MPRIFVPSDVLEADAPQLSGEAAKRLTRVLRLEAGDAFLALDDRGRQHTCRILSVASKSVRFEVEDSQQVTAEPRVELTIAQAIPKGSRMDVVIQKSVELGARQIIPMITDRSIVRPGADPDWESGDESAGRGRRWGLIVAHAAEQSGRGLVPEVTAPQSLNGALALCADCERIFILDETARQPSLLQALAEAGRVNRVAVFVGPEGGFTPVEVERSIGHGAQPVTLGPRILRTETAAIVAVALCMALLGEMEW